MINKLLLVFVTFLLNLYVFSAKTYNLTIRVKSLATHQALEGIKISTVIENVKVEVGVTDANGEFVISSIKEKSMNVEFEDPSGVHNSQTLYYSNYKKVDEVKEIELHFTRKQEAIFFKELDNKYKDSTSILVKQIATGKSSESDMDSIDFIPASPVGGDSEFSSFIARNVGYPQKCIENNIQGKVYLSFIVQADGTITNVAVEKGVHPLLDEEACRVIRYSPKWNPATSEGKPIRALVRTPFSFTLN